MDLSSLRQIEKTAWGVGETMWVGSESMAVGIPVGGRCWCCCDHDGEESGIVKDDELALMWLLVSDRFGIGWINTEGGSDFPHFCLQY